MYYKYYIKRCECMIIKKVIQRLSSHSHFFDHIYECYVSIEKKNKTGLIIWCVRIYTRVSLLPGYIICATVLPRSYICWDIVSSWNQSPLFSYVKMLADNHFNSPLYSLWLYILWSNRRIYVKTNNSRNGLGKLDLLWNWYYILYVHIPSHLFNIYFSHR